MRTALVIAVPEAEPAVASWRTAHDPSAALSVPAHVTLLFPFVPREEVDARTRSTVVEAIARSGVAPFTSRYERTGRFPGVLYLEPEPRGVFEHLIEAFVDAFPAYPPYGGAFGTLVPHLTVVDDERADLDAIEASVHDALPVIASVAEITWIAEGTEGWETLETLPLVSRGA